MANNRLRQMIRASCLGLATMSSGLPGLVPEVFAQPTFQGLGVLPGYSYSVGAGVSADGSVVAGVAYSYAPEFKEVAVRWTSISGLAVLGNSPSFATAVSADGSVIVGNLYGSNLPEVAFRWTADSGIVGLGFLPGGTSSDALGVSADGSVIVGDSWGSNQPTEAVRWIAGNGILGLGFLPGGTYSTAFGVSADGSVIVGLADGSGLSQAFRWTAGSGMVGLGFLPGGTSSDARGVSADGLVVVGYSSSGSGSQAFRWTAGSGMVGLGLLPGGTFSVAYGASADGSVIVGSTNEFQAFIWDTTNGIRKLKDVLVNDFGLDLTGWQLVEAIGISADGRTIVGYGVNPSGNTEAWIARLGTAPPPPSPVLSIDRSFLDFLTITVGTSKDLTFTVENTGGDTLTGSATTSLPFSIVGDSSFSLTANQTKTITVRFAPTSAATFNGNVSITSNGGNASVALTGTGVAPGPQIVSLSDNSGSVGSILIVNGSNFGATRGTSSLQMCGTSVAISHWEDNLIATLVPQLPSGTVCEVRVSTTAGLSNPLPFTVTNLGTISGFLKNPQNKAISGARVVISTAATGIVTSDRKGFYDKSDLVNGQYTVKPILSGYLFTPEERVVTINGVAVSNINFVGASVVPVISKLSPTSGAANTKVTISGSGFGSFDPVVNKVRFGSADASILSWTNSKIVALAPSVSGSVLVTVVTASGTSNAMPFSYSSGTPRTPNINLIPSGDFSVLIFTGMQIVSSDASTVVADITILNNTGTWYVVHPQIVGSVTGPDLPTNDFMMGPLEEMSLGRVTFQKNNQLLFLADNSIDLGSCFPCDIQTRKILGTLALELLWRAVLGSTFPVSEEDWLNLVLETQLDSPLVGLGADLFAGDLIAIVNDLPDVVDDPNVHALLVKYGFGGSLPSWFTLYARAALEARLLIETLIYPHNGQLIFDAK